MAKLVFFSLTCQLYLCTGKKQCAKATDMFAVLHPITKYATERYLQRIVLCTDKINGRARSVWRGKAVSYCTIATLLQ